MNILSASDNDQSAPAGNLTGATVAINAEGGNPPINTVGVVDVGVTPPVPANAITDMTVNEGDGGTVKSAAD